MARAAKPLTDTPAAPKKAGAKTKAAVAAPGAPFVANVNSASKATILPQRGDGGAAFRARMMNSLSTLKEDPRTVMANDYVERSFPTGSIVIDEVLGLREIPMHGRVVQVHGEEHSGKSTLLYFLAGAYQRVYGRPVTIWDLEGQLVPNYLWQCGMNPDPTFTYIRQGMTVEECFRVSCEMLEGDGENPTCDYHIFDSVAYILPMLNKKDSQGKKIPLAKALDTKVGDQAKLFKKFLYNLQRYALRADAALHFVNQQVSVIPQSTKEQMAMKYASITNWNHSISGGKAARYGPSIMLQTAKGKAFEGSDEKLWFLFPTGDGKAGVGKSWDVNKTEIKVLKNKVNNGGYRQYHIYIRPGGGIDDWISVRELAQHYGLVKNVGKDAPCGAGWCVGKPEAPIAMYKTKAQVIEDLVLNENMAVLIPLRELTVEAIRNDDPRAFGYARTKEDMFVAGSTDDPGQLDLEVDDDLGVVEEDDLPPE